MYILFGFLYMRALLMTKHDSLCIIWLCNIEEIEMAV